MAFTPRLVIVTASDLDEARSLARGLVESRLAACVNLLPGVESHYVWKGSVETSTEVMLLIKSTAEQFEELDRFVRAAHSYECPEIVALAPQEITAAYRAWWDEQTRVPVRPDGPV